MTECILDSVVRHEHCSSAAGDIVCCYDGEGMLMLNLFLERNIAALKDGRLNM